MSDTDTPEPATPEESFEAKADAILARAKDLALTAPTWADFSNALFSQHGIVSQAFGTSAERQAFCAAWQYAEIRQLLLSLMKKFGVAEGANPVLPLPLPPMSNEVTPEAKARELSEKAAEAVMDRLGYGNADEACVASMTAKVASIIEHHAALADWIARAERAEAALRELASPPCGCDWCERTAAAALRDADATKGGGRDAG